MSWNNIVSRKDDVELSEKQQSLARKSRRFKKDDTVVFLAKRDQISLVERMFRISSI